MTTAIDQHHTVIGQLGDRWLYLRLPELASEDRERQAMTAMDADELAMRKVLRETMLSYIDGLDKQHPTPSQAVKEKLVRLAVLTTTGRTAVPRDSYGKRDIIGPPAHEMPARFAKQLIGLWRALVVMGHEEPGTIIQRVALDSMPPGRSQVLRLLGEEDAEFPTIRTHHLARDRTVLERISAYGLVDCLDRVRPAGRLDGCRCGLGDDCRHTRTRLDPRNPDIPYQMDYLYASPTMAERLERCEVLAPPEWPSPSDHFPIVATFRS